MTNEELNTALYKKMEAELKEYKRKLRNESPTTIMNSAYELVLKEDIVYAMEYYDLSDQQAKALLNLERPLKDITENYKSCEDGYMDIIYARIENRANALIAEQALTLRNTPVYTASFSHAKEHGETAQHRASYEANVLCRQAIENAISSHFYGYTLNTADAVNDVVEQFGLERTCYVLAATVRAKEWDGRFSEENKQWAKTFDIPQDETPWKTKTYLHYAVSDAHPGLVNLFISRVRKNQEKHKDIPKDKTKESER